MEKAKNSKWLLVGLVKNMAYKAIRRVKKHPVDIIVGTKSRFEPGKGIPSVENEGYQKGVLLYDSGN